MVCGKIQLNEAQYSKAKQEDNICGNNSENFTNKLRDAKKQKQKYTFMNYIPCNGVFHSFMMVLIKLVTYTDYPTDIHRKARKNHLK